MTEPARRACRVCAGFSAWAWMMSWITLRDPVVSALATRWTGSGFPWALADPWLVVVPWIGIPLLGVVVVHRPHPTLLRVHAWLWLVSTTYLAGHEVTLGNAAFFGGIWVAAWQVWLVETHQRRPARSDGVGPVLAVLVASALFLPAATGKLAAGYVDGSVWTALARVKSPSALDLVPGLHLWSRSWSGPVFAKVALAGEFSIALAWLAPVRVALAWIALVVAAMTLCWSWGLLPITGQVLGLAVAAWFLTESPTTGQAGDAVVSETPPPPEDPAASLE